jgi:aspartate aminotransferase-like enzyme
LVNNAELCAEMTRAGADALGLKLFSPSAPAAALTAIEAPKGIDSGLIVKAFRETFNAVVANGQGEMKGQLFRLAHIGYYDYLDTVGVLAALEQVLAEVTGRPVEFGAGVRAAPEVWARVAQRQTAGV